MDDLLKEFFAFLRDKNPEKASEIEYYLKKEGIDVKVGIWKIIINYFTNRTYAKSYPFTGLVFKEDQEIAKEEYKENIGGYRERFTDALKVEKDDEKRKIYEVILKHI